MKTAPLVTCHILDTGYCLASERHIMRGGERRQIQCHSMVALLHHPLQGWLLWDAGYAPRLFDVTRSLPFALYRRATPLRVCPEQAVAAQLSRFGLSPSDVRHVVISHFHADHIAGLRDFPEATLISTAAAYADVAPRTGFSALYRAFIPALLPDDFVQRAMLLPSFVNEAIPELGATHDLFGDGALRCVSLPGHARGQMGMLAQTERGPVLFAADGAWLTRAIRERCPPGRITNLIADDAAAVQTTIDRLHRFMAAHPETRIIPTHCPEAYAREVENV